jgi:hypothetical protein
MALTDATTGNSRGYFILTTWDMSQVIEADSPSFIKTWDIISKTAPQCIELKTTRNIPNAVSAEPVHIHSATCQHDHHTHDIQSHSHSHSHHDHSHNNREK